MPKIRKILSDLLGLSPKEKRLKEESYPRDKSGKPDLSCYSDSLEYYIEMYEQGLHDLSGPNLPHHEFLLATNRRAFGQWGLIAKGAAAIPYALTLMQHRESRAREDGAAIIQWVRADETSVEPILNALIAETDETARDTMIGTLGALRSRKAIPALEAIIRDKAGNSDTRWTAVESLGDIVGRRFDNQPDSIKAAIEWLDSTDGTRS